MKNALFLILFFPLVIFAQDYSIDFIPDSLPALPGQEVRFFVKIINHSEEDICFSSKTIELEYYLHIQPSFENVNLTSPPSRGVVCFDRVIPDFYPGYESGAVKTCYKSKSTTLEPISTQITPTKIEYYDGRELFINIKFHAIDCKGGSVKTFEQRVAVKTIKLRKPEREYWGSQVKVEDGDYKIKMVKTRFDLAAANRLINRCKKCETVPIVQLQKIYHLSQDSLTLPKALALVRKMVKTDKGQPHYKKLVQLYIEIFDLCRQTNVYPRCVPRLTEEEYNNAKKFLKSLQ